MESNVNMVKCPSNPWKIKIYVMLLGLLLISPTGQADDSTAYRAKPENWISKTCLGENCGSKKDDQWQAYSSKYKIGSIIQGVWHGTISLIMLPTQGLPRFIKTTKWTYHIGFFVGLFLYIPILLIIVGLLDLFDVPEIMIGLLVIPAVILTAWAIFATAWILYLYIF